MMFMGEYQHSIDAKGRLSIPAKFRDALTAGFVVTKGLEHCLFIFDRSEWDIIAGKLAQSSMTKRDSRDFTRQFLSGASEVELDKQGRVLLPANLRTYAGLEKDVVVIGVGTRLEIWDKNKWDAYINEVSDDYENIAEEFIDTNLG